MGERVVLETPCDHGEMGPHFTCDLRSMSHYAQPGHSEKRCECPGGSRRVLEPAQPNYDRAANQVVNYYRGDFDFLEAVDFVTPFVDAALEGLRLVKETD